MFTNLGYDIVVYWGPGHDGPGEHVPLVTRAEQERWFGGHDENDLDRGGFDWNGGSPWWRVFNHRAIAELLQRSEPGDLVLLASGPPCQYVKDSLPDRVFCEPGVGYFATIGPAAFESRAWMHHVYGLNKVEDGRWLDTVIPNFFDPAEFPRLNNGRGKYLLYMGRLIGRKGVQTAATLAEQFGIKLVVAGPGGTGHGPGWVGTAEGRIEGATLEYVGPVGIAERAELLAGAACVLVPTTYIEPFGGIAVEANMAGTPVVTTPWGAFSETVVPGVNGYHLRHATDTEAVEAAMKLKPKAIREHALDRYSLKAVGPMYTEWFDRLADGRTV